MMGSEDYRRQPVSPCAGVDQIPFSFIIHNGLTSTEILPYFAAKHLRIARLITRLPSTLEGSGLATTKLTASVSVAFFIH